MTNILISFNSLPRIVHVWIDLFHWKYNQNFPIASTVYIYRYIYTHTHIYIYIYILLQGFVLEKPSHDILHQKYSMISYVMFTITFWVIHTDCSAPGGKQSWKRHLTHIPLENGRHSGRRHFQINFLELRGWNSDWNFTEICSQLTSSQHWFR